MSAIPTNLARVPVTLASNVFLNNLTRANTRMLNTQVQMATGNRIHHPSDDVVASSMSSLLDLALNRGDQMLRNLQHGDSLISVAEQNLSEASNIVLEAKDIAMSMIGPGADAETRRQQAQIINSMLDEMHSLSNANYQNMYLFSGQRTDVPAFEGLLGGYVYQGTRDGMELDFGPAITLPVTIGGQEAFGALSQRVDGYREPGPDLTGSDNLTDLDGARGLGITLGSIRIDLDGLDQIDVDLTSADSVQDVIDIIDNAIGEYETEEGVTLLEGSRMGINATESAFMIDVAAGVTITIEDIGTGITGADLGLSQAAFTNANTDGSDLSPRITDMTLLTDLNGLSDPIADFVISNMGQERTIEASSADNILDLKNLIKQADIGARLEIDEEGHRINLVNELSGGHMAVYEANAGQTAEILGIRTLTRSTRLSDFNDGRGVQIVSGSENPADDLDFRITLTDGTSFDVDLAGAETAGDVLDLIRAAAPPSFQIGIDDNGPNGFILADTAGGTGTLSVTPLGTSYAAQDLGILVAGSGATLAGEDRSTVEVDSVFSHLIALRDALEANDESGITIAGGKFEQDIDRFAQARAILGQRANRIDAMTTRQEDQQVLNLSLKSEIHDLDYAEASVRFSTLQVQIQAAMIAGSQANSLSLIQFLR